MLKKSFQSSLTYSQASETKTLWISAIRAMQMPPKAIHNFSKKVIHMLCAKLAEKTSHLQL